MVWVDFLCKQIACDRKLDFAQLFPRQAAHKRGSVVDNGLFGNATRSLNLTLESNTIPDLKTQVSQFLSEEVSRSGLHWMFANDGQTISTLCFGIWEIWAFVELAESEAQRAVSESVGSLFVELDHLLDSIMIQGGHSQPSSSRRFQIRLGSQGGMSNAQARLTGRGSSSVKLSF